jgi:hypothetical protein
VANEQQTQKQIIISSYIICLVAALAAFFIKKEVSFGIIFGTTIGTINFFFIKKQIDIFMANKKVFFMFLGYVLRYALLVAILYFTIKRNMFLSIGTLAGFFIAQITFLRVNVKNL